MPPAASKVRSAQRLFFAVWPDPATGAQLLRLAARLLPPGKGRCTPAENLHLTLVFLGSVGVSDHQCMEQVAQGIHTPRFTLMLDQVGYWPHNGILWAAASQVPAALLALVEALRQGMTPCDLVAEARAYRPHITLARRVVRRPRDDAMTPIAWQVERFTLVQSSLRASGARYQILRTWDLV